MADNILLEWASPDTDKWNGLVPKAGSLEPELDVPP